MIEMKISVEDVRYIAKLAKLSITFEEAQKMVGEFEGILTYFESIDRLDLSDILPNPPERDTGTVLRKDEISVFEDKQKLFLNAKSMRDSYISVPKIIE
ncbi:MAG TPA: Asp-tRNA(Asn)/Glu-tRNA(Gln) amidotransferase subunit GatC [Bacillota bacterium]|nr:Asp-tRNA(Asn)/Glu-tRNA(Gln) amidotransferase subunit GatC [Bacillota bacterium]HQL35879.1 Asp-tRNA(Asn)/Glu-tRNA(Gln) amidotransferase subunit GatC [Bacillota bacterium]